jgi:hypothetical protein
VANETIFIWSVKVEVINMKIKEWQVTWYTDNVAKAVVLGEIGKGIRNSQDTAKVQGAQAGVRCPRTVQSCLPRLEAETTEQKK